MKYAHKSFYGFYPSDVFDLKDETLKKLEQSNRSLEELSQLESLYSKALSSIPYEEIKAKSSYSKNILQLSRDDIEYFSKSNQKTASELVSLFSLFVSVMALGLTVFGKENLTFLFFGFCILAICGTCWSYVHATNLRTLNNEINEMYRCMLMCFETAEEAGRNKTYKLRKDGNRTEASSADFENTTDIGDRDKGVDQHG